MVEVRRKVLKENDLLARRLRDRFHSSGIRVISVVSSPGSGKTTLLERLLTDLHENIGWRRWWVIWLLRMMQRDWPDREPW